MKRYYGWILCAAFTASLLFYSAHNHTKAQGTPDAAASKKAEAEYQRMLDEQANSFRRAEVLLKEQEGQHKRVEALLAKQENLFKKQEEDLKRYEKILDTWEKQQQQYQKYLDSLSKK